jgi:uncharacterized membrane protein (DUF4010 family)
MYPSLVEPVLKPVIVMVIAGLLPALYLLWLTTTERIPALEQENPFRLKPALTFGAIFAVILLVSDYSLKYYGNTGILVTAWISGLADVDAITLSVGRLMENGKLAKETAARAIVIGAISNTAMKAGLTWILGRVKLAFRVTAVLAFSVFSGVVYLLLM